MILHNKFVLKSFRLKHDNDKPFDLVRIAADRVGKRSSFAVELSVDPEFHVHVF